MRISRISGMVAGLLVTFVGQTFGHDIDPADSCSGYSCSTPGQQCGPGVQGAYNDAYVCSEEKQWIRVPSTWEEDPSLFALLFHGHDHDEVEGLFNSSENESMYTQAEVDDEVAEATADMYTQAEVDAQVAKATADMYTQAEVDDEVAKATAGMYTQAEVDAQVAQSQCVATLAPDELGKATCSDLQTYLNAYDDVSIYHHDNCGRKGIRLSTAWQSDEKDLYDVTCSSLTTYFNNYDAVSHHYKVNCGMTVYICDDEVAKATADMYTQAEVDALNNWRQCSKDLNSLSYCREQAKRCGECAKAFPDR